MQIEPIYLDHAATTPTDPEVVAAMLPFFGGLASRGNPSSVHYYGRNARAALDEARDAVARLIHADYSEITFTGSGTEADNLALIGVLRAAPDGRNHLVTSAIEHHAVLHTAHFLAGQGYEITVVPVDSEGQVDLNALETAITDRTALVSVMHANNEIGTIQPIAEIARLAHRRGARFHTDAVQTAGLLSVDVRALDCDLLTLCAHKMYGPKGAGALYIRQGTPVLPIIHGGTQEREKRAGTENVPALVGFGRAAELAAMRRDADAGRMEALRDGFLNRLKAEVPGLRLNGHPQHRLPNNLNVSVADVEGPTLLMRLDRQGVAASSGSACSSGSIEPSHVLKAIGLPDRLASSGVRFTLGRTTTWDELATAANIYADTVHRMLANRRA
jgi:cysteine desulfurase